MSHLTFARTFHLIFMDAALLADPASKPTVLLLLLLLSLASALQTRLQSATGARRIVPLTTAVPASPAALEDVAAADTRIVGGPTLPPRDQLARNRRRPAKSSLSPRNPRRLPVVLRPVGWAARLVRTVVGSVLKNPVGVAAVVRASNIAPAHALSRVLTHAGRL
jgi:hypothetical protein